MRHERDKGGRTRDPKRDTEILRRILAGQSNARISRELGIHRNTASLMRRRMRVIGDDRIRDFIRAAEDVAKAKDKEKSASVALDKARQEREFAERLFDAERSVLLLQQLAGERRPTSVVPSVSIDAETRSGGRIGDMLGI